MSGTRYAHFHLIYVQGCSKNRKDSFQTRHAKKRGRYSLLSRGVSGELVALKFAIDCILFFLLPTKSS